MTGVGAGTIYPMLARFESNGWLKSQWEDISPSDEGRPRKRLYSLTGVGIRSARAELEAINNQGGYEPCPA